MRRFTILCAVLALAGCANTAQTPIATIDLLRIQANWPLYINYHNQLQVDANAIDRSRGSIRDKQAQMAALNARFVSMQNEITGDVTSAAQQVANERHFSLVVTRQYVGYGGTDITADVEKILKITEAATPKP